MNGYRLCAEVSLWLSLALWLILFFPVTLLTVLRAGTTLFHGARLVDMSAACLGQSNARMLVTNLKSIN